MGATHTAMLQGEFIDHDTITVLQTTGVHYISSSQFTCTSMQNFGVNNLVHCPSMAISTITCTCLKHDIVFWVSSFQYFMDSVFRTWPTADAISNLEGQTSHIQSSLT